MVSLIIGILGV